MIIFKGYTGREVALSLQHLFAMFGATILVPILTGLDTSVALLTAGLGTLVFHFVTKMKVPIFLGSSFAFIPGITAVVANQGAQYAGGAIIVAGAMYFLFALLVFALGVQKIKKVFPPVVVGPIVILIGLSLVGVGIDNSSGHLASDTESAFLDYPWLSWLVACFVLVVILVLMLRGKGIFKLLPILCGILAGYLLCLILYACGLNVMGFETVHSSNWFNIPYYSEGFLHLPKFEWSSIVVIAPVSIVTFMEQIGAMSSVSSVIGKNVIEDPGLHRTSMGDGLATMLAGFLGGPANTTYSENIAVLATTKNFDPKLIRLCAMIAIALAFFGKFGAILQTIPSPVIGGVSIVLFGMIATCGVMILVESKIDFKNSRNLVISSLILSVGLGFILSEYHGNIEITQNFSLSAIFVATVVGILANLLLPKDKSNIGENK
ncbi:MAG: uracil-xanthine permease family protein [Clostridiales bacterium]|nr:uracil-xanthine permease family protein [Clostridiales bacterium]